MLFIILLCGSNQANVLNLGVLPMIVHQAPCCGVVIVFIFDVVRFSWDCSSNSPSSVTVGGSLSLVARSGNTAISILLDLISCR